MQYHKLQTATRDIYGTDGMLKIAAGQRVHVYECSDPGYVLAVKQTTRTGRPYDVKVPVSFLQEQKP